MIPRKIAKEIKDIVRALKAEFENNFLALILYGSWVKRRAREDSDIDLYSLKASYPGRTCYERGRFFQ